MNGNFLSDKAIEAIAKGIEGNKSLTSLSMLTTTMFHEMRQSGDIFVKRPYYRWRKLLEAIIVNNTITSLEIFAECMYCSRLALLNKKCGDKFCSTKHPWYTKEVNELVESLMISIQQPRAKTIRLIFGLQ